MKKIISVKNILVILFTVMIVTFAILIGPMDIFHHGSESYNREVPGYEPYEISDTDYIIQSLIPDKEYFNGFNIIMLNLPEDKSGQLYIEVMNDQNELLEVIELSTSSVTPGEWVAVPTTVKLEKNELYSIKFSAVNCSTNPSLLITSFEKNARENKECYYGKQLIMGGLVVDYAYSISTFTFYEKIYLIAGLFIIYSIVLFKIYDKNRKYYLRVKNVSAFCLLLMLLTWTYLFNTFDRENESFSTFQKDSESLVASVIIADDYGVLQTKYGLGTYYMTGGSLLDNYSGKYLVNSVTDGYNLGYSTTDAGFLVPLNSYTTEYFKEGREVQFLNNEKYKIKKIEKFFTGNLYSIDLETNLILSEKNQGPVDRIKLIDENGNPYPAGTLTAYLSQYGLQGKIFRHLAAYMEDDKTTTNLYLICAVLTAAVFMGIVTMVKIKYNDLMAICFFVVFWLSPWIINFAKNLYWVEFTWFLPMLTGLICSNYKKIKSLRVACYFGMFLTIFIKCLCGYEYITVIMLGGIAFLLIDFITAILNKEKEEVKKQFFIILIMGAAALLGFIAAILIHANLRGDGNIITGVISIFKEDVIRRTAGNNPGDINASAWRVLLGYFHFSTDIISGISGKLFPLLSIAPLLIFLWKYLQNTIDKKEIVMYLVFFVTGASWFVLAKAHSVIHIHMNFVLWYFGYVQICLYIVLKHISKWIKNIEKICDSEEKE